MFLKRIITICFMSNLFAQIDTVLTIDASSYSDWVYFSFEEAQELPDLTPEEEEEAREQQEWQDYMDSIPTAAERNR